MAGNPFPPPPLKPPSSMPEGWPYSSGGGALPGLDPRPRRRSRLWLHVLLFVLTIGSTALFVSPVYSACVMLILTAHELGHYFAARYYRVKASLPYFIPFPSLLGTLGAVIRMSPFIPHRKALFDIAAAGPIAGLVFAIPVSFIGIALSQPHIPDPERPLLTLGDPLLFRAMEWVLFGARQEGADLLLHDVAFAGWVGLFVTALNLLPISQLDGGHINYALFSRKGRYVAMAAFAAVGITTVIQGFHYTVILALLWFMGIGHPPTLNDSLDLGRGRKWIGFLLAVVFVLCFTPAPFKL